MPKTYTLAGQEVLQLAAKVMKLHHDRLVEAGVEITYLMVSAARDKKTGEPTGPALKLHGYPCRAIVKINSLKDRVAGKADADVQLDGDQWDGWMDAEQEAIIDHELTHLVATGESDDAGRPKLEMRNHDWQLGGFASVVEHYGDAATDKQAVDALWKEYRELLCTWETAFAS
jgi:hypothetical protein